MGESDRYIEYKDLKKKRILLGSEQNALMGLVALNAIGFLLLLTMQVVYFFYQESAASYTAGVVKWFELPANVQLLITRPWTLFTYMFIDNSQGLMRIISNLFWLWTFGTILQDRLGNNRLIPVCIYGGILGALFFILVHYLPTPLQAHTNFASLMGANAAVMAVATAATFIAPDYRFFAHIRKGMPIWVMLALFVFIDLAGVAQNNPAYAIAHLGGGIAGWIFIYFIKRNIDIGNWMNTSYHFITHIFSPAKIESKQTIKNKVFYNTGSRTPYQKTALINEQKINQILEKIHLNGFDSLTDEEKDFLNKAAKED